ncbi:acyl-CoA carboxylase subunit epsilon [Sphaerisporangium dianthi]|uniref:Acyl-CoA carboxylase subunit epsilon n=1 Tax=Sphaerisporangium dianthi TaxID=1436120 RepID=A0ABV9CJY3_9ACTN
MTQGFYMKVVRGNPTPEELAALIAVLNARTASNGAASEAHAAETAGAAEIASAWLDGSRTVRKPVVAGPGPAAWRVSGWAG